MARRDLIRPCCFGASGETSFLNMAQLSGALYTRDGVLPVPEPGTAVLMLCGAMLVWARQRRGKPLRA